MAPIGTCDRQLTLYRDVHFFVKIFFIKGMFYCNFVFFWLHLQKKKKEKQCTATSVHVLCSYSSIKGFMSCLTHHLETLFHRINVEGGLRGFSPVE